MKCPFCSSAMESGRVSIERKFTARPALGTELEFAPKEGSTVVPKLGDVALHCQKCDTLILRGAFAESLECFECGAAIPEDADACRSCGWSWDEGRPPGGYRDPA
jgi:ribosomal protein L40E